MRQVSGTSFATVFVTAALARLLANADGRGLPPVARLARDARDSVGRGAIRSTVAARPRLRGLRGRCRYGRTHAPPPARRCRTSGLCRRNAVSLSGGRRMKPFYRALIA
jgi:hypothetical protein